MLLVAQTRRRLRSASSAGAASSLAAFASFRFAIDILTAAAIIAAALLTTPPAFAQPAKVDWRAAVILRLEPAESGDGMYLKGFAERLDSGWIDEAGITAVSIGPVLAREGVVGHSTLASDVPQPVSFLDFIESSRGSADGYARLAAAARRANLPLIQHLQASAAPMYFARVAEWAAESGTHHFVLHGGDGDDVRTLRTALQAAGVHNGWIAANIAGEEPSADAFIESVEISHLDDDATLNTLYAQAAQRSAGSSRPTITSVAIPHPVSTELMARMLLYPGALEIALEDLNADGAATWQRIAAFRSRHPAIGLGEHVDLVNNTFAFGRTAGDPTSDDRVVVVLGASGPTTVNVSRIFPDNTLLYDTLTGGSAFVSFGMATFDPGPEGVILIEEVR